MIQFNQRETSTLSKQSEITLTLLPGATTVMDTTINMIAVTLR